MSDDHSSGWGSASDSHQSYSGTDSMSDHHRNCTSTGDPRDSGGHSETAFSPAGANDSYDDVDRGRWTRDMGEARNTSYEAGASNASPQTSPNPSYHVSTIDNAIDKLIDAAASVIDAAHQALDNFVGRFSGSMDSPSSHEAVDALKASLQHAFSEHPNACNFSTASVARDFGINELDNMKANAQVAYMIENWKEIDSHTAKDYASTGRIVVAGLQNPEGSGHTAIVSPGAGAEINGEFYPNVSGGGMSDYGRSDGHKTAYKVWGEKHCDDVRYYTPKHEAKIKSAN